MENESNGNSYEDARKQRLLENKKRFEDLGLSKLSKSLSDAKKSEKSQKQHIRRKPSEKYLIEPRRSSRARNPVPSYHDDVDLDQLPSLRKRKKLSSSWASYLARPIEEVKSATYEERARAHKCAEKLLSSLKAGNPSFVKSMVRSHVYSCFWLGLPSKFCEENLPGSTVDMVLEDEAGSEYDAVFISKRTGLSGGWRAFALDHKLDDGDALVFELIEPTKFKVYIVRAFDCEEEITDNVPVPETGSDDEETPKDVKKRKKSDNKCQIKNSTKSDESPIKNSTKSDENGSSQVSGTRRSLRNKK